MCLVLSSTCKGLEYVGCSVKEEEGRVNCLLHSHTNAMYIDYVKLCNNSLINPMFMFLGYCVMRVFWRAAQHLLPADKPLVYAAYPNLPADSIPAAPQPQFQQPQFQQSPFVVQKTIIPSIQCPNILK